MKTMSAREAKNGFGLLVDTARLEPVTVEKHGRPVVVVLSVEEYRRLCGADSAGGISDIGDRIGSEHSVSSRRRNQG